MTLRLAAVLATENAEHSEQAMSVSPWIFGIAAMAGFLILLAAVTRLNLDR